MQDFKTVIFQDPRTVFSFNDIAMLFGVSQHLRLRQQLNYYVKKGLLLNLRRGIYAKTEYNPEEIAGNIFKPSYISLQYVLQKEGVIFQYDSQITSVSYLSRTINIDGNSFCYKKIKNSVLLDTTGILRGRDGCNIATAERAFLDILYLNKEFYFDNPSKLDRNKLEKLILLYDSKSLVEKVERVFNGI